MFFFEKYNSAAMLIAMAIRMISAKP